MADAQPAPRPGRVPLRTSLALGAGRLASGLSARLGRGRGGVVGGVVALRLAPGSLAHLARGRQVALVSATNGKSTTTALLAAALETAGPVATNHLGSNMAAGLIVGLAASPTAPAAALEVDEAYLGPIASETRPRAIVLMNLSRDYLERGVRYKKLVRHWRETVAAVDWPCTIVANADDPLVAWAVRSARTVVWVAGEDDWSEDGAICRDCLVGLRHDDSGRWWCEQCGQRRPEPDWRLVGDTAVGPGVEVPIHVEMPGRVNRLNALFAVAAARELGIEPATAARACARVRDVEGRYGRRDLHGRSVRLLLSKNPASWLQTVEMMEESPEDALVFDVTARGDYNARDTSLVWDAPIERLAGRPAIATGYRASDIGLRLEVAGLEVTAVPDPFDAISACAPGPVTVACNYPAFLELHERLERSARPA